MAEVRTDLGYTKEHEWVKIDGNVATIGITDYAQKRLGDIVFAEGEPEGTDLDVGDICGAVESVKSASDLFSPVAGSIVAVNEELFDAPEAINKDPYGSWFIKVELSGDAPELLDAAAYEAICTE